MRWLIAVAGNILLIASLVLSVTSEATAQKISSDDRVAALEKQVASLTRALADAERKIAAAAAKDREIVKTARKVLSAKISENSRAASSAASAARAAGTNADRAHTRLDGIRFELGRAAYGSMVRCGGKPHGLGRSEVPTGKYLVIGTDLKDNGCDHRVVYREVDVTVPP